MEWKRDEIHNYYMNPLDIPKILSTVYESLSVWNLKKCCQVCHFWRSEARRVLLKKSKIVFKTEGQISSFDPLTNNSQSFELESIISLESEVVKEFFRAKGSAIKCLDLSFHHEYGVSWTQALLPELVNLEELCVNGRARWLHEDTNIGDLQHFQKLKFLFIYDSSFDLEGDLILRSIWSQNIFQILASAPNLQRLFFAPFLESKAKAFFDVLSSTSLSHPFLSHLHINHLAASRVEINALTFKRFPLTYVHLVLSPNLLPDDLNLFLETFRCSLRELTLTFTEGSSCVKYHPIASLEELTKLSIIGYEGPLQLSQAPRLQLFVMSLPDCPFDFENSEMIGIKRELLELEIYDHRSKYEIGNLKQLFINFSLLHSLKLNCVDNSILRGVWSFLLSLTELHIKFHKFYGVRAVQLDSGITGIPESDFNEGIFDCWDYRQIDLLRRYSWIGNLKSLKTLELEVGRYSDFGIVLGLCRCPSLKKLVLKNHSDSTSRCSGLQEDSNNCMGNEPTNAALSRTLTERSLDSLRNDLDLHYLKLEGFNQCFGQEKLHAFKSAMAGREIYLL